MADSFEKSVKKHDYALKPYDRFLTCLARILFSRPFKFFIGVDKAPAMVYEAAIAAQSPSLATFLCERMSENPVGEATWEDVDKETFARFIEFTYSEDYSVPGRILKDQLNHQHQEHQEHQEPVDDYDFGWGNSAAKKKKVVRGPPLQLFDSLSYDVKPQSKFAGTYESAITRSSNENLHEDIGDILIIHASLYALGEKWGLEELKTLTLSKLHGTLKRVPREEFDIQHIVKLTRFVYSDENTPDWEDGIDRLRELVCYYNTTVVELSMKNSAFLALIEEGGPFVRDFWKIAAPMIHSTR